MLSRRAAAASSALALLGLVPGSVFGQSQEDVLKKNREEALERAQGAIRGAQEAKRKEMLERMDPEQRAFFERMSSATSVEEQMKIAQDWQLQHILAKLKSELGVSEEEWSVVQPRLVTVYRLVRAQLSLGTADAGPSALLVSQRTNELQELLSNKEAKPEEIKAKLITLRAAQEQVRQELIRARASLRKIMTLRQEAVLVLNGLLD